MSSSPRHRFATPAEYFRAVVAQDSTIAHLEWMLAQARAERRALDQDGYDYLKRAPQGVTYHEHLFRAEGGGVVVGKAPLDAIDLDGWELPGAEAGAEAEAVGPGDGAPSYTVPSDDKAAEAVYAHADTFGTNRWPYDGKPPYRAPANADTYPAEVGLLGHLVGVEVRDEDGDDYL